MANLIIYPHNEAEKALEASPVNPDDVYNDRDGITRAQLTAINALPYASDTIKKNTYLTIHRLHASANKANVDFAANVKNTMVGSISSAFMQAVDENLSENQKKTTMIKWLPSSANEPDPFHALNYGKTMSLDQAIKKGLGQRYGCQCGMEILNGSKKTQENLDNLINVD